MLIVNDEKFVRRAEIIREKGTNRNAFFRGAVDKYSWIDIGSSYLPSEIQAAFLWGQLEKAEEIGQNRLATWYRYSSGLQALEDAGLVSLPAIPADCQHNGHMFYLKVENVEQRTELLSHLIEANVHAVFHYVPLHSASAGLRFGQFHGEDRFTTTESERLIRLPMLYGMKQDDIDSVISAVTCFFR